MTRKVFGNESLGIPRKMWQDNRMTELVSATLKAWVLLADELSVSVSKDIRNFCPVPTYFYNILGYDLLLVSSLYMCKRLSVQFLLFK